jgi:hypothetical protein
MFSIDNYVFRSWRFVTLYYGFHILEIGAENIFFVCVCVCLYEVGLSNNNLNISIHTVKKY